MMTDTTSVSRRGFIVTTVTAAGGMALGFHIPVSEAEAAVPARPWTGEPRGEEVNAWIVIAPDDTVTIRVAQSEMGEGVFTSMPMIVAEELQCDWGKVRAEYADANRSIRENRVYQRMATGGSGAVRLSRKYLQQAGASARERLIVAGAARLGVDPTQCRAEAGRVIHTASGRAVNYGAVAAEAAKVQLAQEPAIKTPDRFTLLGKDTRRLDTAVKIDGSAVYGIDVRVPNMLYAAVETAPVWGGRLVSHDAAAVRNLPGVVKVVEVPGGVAVVADSWWRAKKAVEAMPKTWDEGPNADVSTASLRAEHYRALEQDGARAHAAGDAAAALRTAARTVEATYELPYLHHAPMEPMNCTAHVTPERVDVWVGTQNPEGAMAAAAEVAGVDPSRVFVHNCFLGGGFGRRSRNDDVRMAVAIARQLDRPVKMVWSREEDMRRGVMRPMATIRFRAGLDQGGKPVAWWNRIVCDSIFATFRPESIQNGVDRTSVEGLQHLPYAIPAQYVDYVQRNTHVPVHFWRSVGSSQNAFALESFIDELAFAAKRDPYEYRRELLAGKAEWLKVLDTAAEKGDWGKPLPQGKARGIAIHECFGSIAAQVIELALTKSGELKIERVVCAIDCGNVVNPLNIAMQMESCVAYGLTAALYGEITIERGRVAQSNFDNYEMLRLDEMPVVETHLALSGGEKWGGIGEPGVPPVAPAVCNAIFRITGKRIRTLPLKHQDLGWA